MSVQFSILVPAYNREKYIIQCIDSVLCQTFTDFEIFVIDDGSTDRTLDVLHSYGARIKVIRQSNEGPEVARNKAAAMARGEYLVLLDSDDVLLPHALDIYDRVIQKFGSPPLILGAMTEFYDGQPLPLDSQHDPPVSVLEFQDYLSVNVKGLRVSSSRIVVRACVFREVGGLRNTTPKTFHLDSLNLMLKLSTYRPCLVVHQPSTVGYRHHDSNTIRNLEAITNGILVLAGSERHGEYPGGKERRYERRAAIGAMALAWTARELLRHRQVRLALRLLAGTGFMGASAVWKKVSTGRRKVVTSVVLDESKQVEGTGRLSK